MADIILPTYPSPVPKWGEIRRGVKRCIKAGAPTARVYSRWPLKYDIGQTIKLLKSTSDERIHSWMISVASATPSQYKIGGHVVEWNITLRIWGFMGYAFGTDDANTQDVIENEAKYIGDILFLNRSHLGLENSEGLSEVGFLVFEDIDVHGFGEGVDVHVAQGSLTFRLSEQLLT